MENSDYNNNTESATTAPQNNLSPTQDPGRLMRNGTFQDGPQRFSETLEDNKDIVLSTEQIMHNYHYETQPIPAEKESNSYSKSNESMTGVFTIVKHATIFSPEFIVAELTTAKSNTPNEHKIAVRNTTISYEKVNENNIITEALHNIPKNQRESSQDGEITHNNMNLTEKDNLTETHTTTTKLKVTKIMDSDVTTTDNHITTTPTGETQTTIDVNIHNKANEIVHISVLAGFDETDKSSATTSSYGDISADSHTTSDSENTTTFRRVISTDNIAKPIIVASTNQSAFPLDNHESAFNATIPEFDETESTRSNETETEMLPVVNNTTISPEISVATLTAGTTTSNFEHETALRNTTISYENLNENKTISRTSG